MIKTRFFILIILFAQSISLTVFASGKSHARQRSVKGYQPLSVRESYAPTVPLVPAVPLTLASLSTARVQSIMAAQENFMDTASWQ